MCCVCVTLVLCGMYVCNVCYMWNVYVLPVCNVCVVCVLPVLRLCCVHWVCIVRFACVQLVCCVLCVFSVYLCVLRQHRLCVLVMNLMHIWRHHYGSIAYTFKFDLICYKIQNKMLPVNVLSLFMTECESHTYTVLVISHSRAAKCKRRPRVYQLSL